MAVVASMDRWLTRFAADVFMQGPRVEIIKVCTAPCLTFLLGIVLLSRRGERCYYHRSADCRSIHRRKPAALSCLAAARQAGTLQA